MAYHLNQVWVHIDHYGDAYANNQEIIQAITENLDGEAVERVTQLHNEDTPELGNIDDFLQKLRSRFEDEAQSQEAEAEIKAIKQRGCPAKEYVREFCRIARKL